MTHSQKTVPVDKTSLFGKAFLFAFGLEALVYISGLVFLFTLVEWSSTRPHTVPVNSVELAPAGMYEAGHVDVSVTQHQDGVALTVQRRPDYGIALPNGTNAHVTREAIML